MSAVDTSAEDYRITMLLLDEAISLGRRDGMAGQHLGAMCDARDTLRALLAERDAALTSEAAAIRQARARIEQCDKLRSERDAALLEGRAMQRTINRLNAEAVAGREKLVAALAKLAAAREALHSIVGMTADCADAPTDPSSLPQMTLAAARAALKDIAP